MKVFTFYSETHESMLKDWFLRTIPKDVEVILKKIPQECTTGEFETDGWMKSMVRKVQYIIDCCEEETEVFIHADCDIQFFNPFKNEILKRMEEEGLDILAQEDIPGPICCGFMAIKPSKVTSDLFREVLSVMSEKNINDQHSLNYLITRDKSINWATLDERYYSVWRSLGAVWDGTKKIENIPTDIVMHHANFVEGVDLKDNCLSVVRASLHNAAF